MDRQEAERQLQELAPAVAVLLGWELADRDDSHIVEMVAPEGFHVYFNAGWTGGYDKISISAGWPRDDEGRQVMSSYDAKTPRINVSVTRAPKEVAREIERRLLPEWIPMWNAARECLQRDRQYEGDTKSNAVRLARIVGVDKSEIDKNGRFSLYRSEIFPENLSDVKVSGDSVTLEIKCDMDDAEAILKALVELNR